MNRCAQLAALAVLVLATPALAADNEIPGTGVTFRSAPGWTVKVVKGIQTVSTPDGAIRTEIRSFTAAEAEKAMPEIEQHLTRTIKDYAETVKAQEIEMAGMKGVLGEAKGKVDGRDVEVALLVLHTPSGKFVLMITHVDLARAGKHEKAFADFLESIKVK